MVESKVGHFLVEQPWSKVDEIACCPRRSKFEPPRRPNIEPGVEADFESVGCG
jgi:hypothetical protein